MMMLKLRSKRFSRSNSKLSGGSGNGAGGDGKGCGGGGGGGGVGEIKWEQRPGGMLVQKRDNNEEEELITLRISSVSQCHDITIQPTSTFGELKMILSLVTCMEPREQRLLFKGKEREDSEHLHMVGIRDKDKVLLLEDPAIKERKLMELARTRGQAIGTPYHTISV
ncbi:unnamed protein product [Camellia sinensis]